MNEKRLSWFRDQYEYSLERKHSIDEVIDWFQKNSISFIGPTPSQGFEFNTISEMIDKGIVLRRFFAQVVMLFSNLGGARGLCTTVGKKQKRDDR